MRRFISILTLGVLTACGGSGPGTTLSSNITAVSGGGTTATGGGTTATGGGTTAIPDTVNNLSFASLLNNVRIANSVAPVAFDARLAAAALGHATDMLNQNYFSHTGLNGSSPGDRITAAGYNWQTYGENIAFGQTSEAEVLTDWVNSPAHQENNIDPGFKDFGLGKAGTGGQTKWVLVLGSEQ